MPVTRAAYSGLSNTRASELAHGQGDGPADFNGKKMPLVGRGVPRSRILLARFGLQCEQIEAGTSKLTGRPSSEAMERHHARVLLEATQKTANLSILDRAFFPTGRRLPEAEVTSPPGQPRVSAVMVTISPSPAFRAWQTETFPCGEGLPGAGAPAKVKPIESVSWLSSLL